MTYLIKFWTNHELENKALNYFVSQISVQGKAESINPEVSIKSLYEWFMEKERFDMRQALLRAKAEYGRAFEQLARE